jgi:hypothetical protein
MIVVIPYLYKCTIKKRRRPLRRTSARNACEPWCHFDFFNPHKGWAEVQLLARSGGWVPHKHRRPGKITLQLHQPLYWQRHPPLPVGESLVVDGLAVLASVEQSPTLPESACQ